MRKIGHIKGLALSSLACAMLMSGVAGAAVTDEDLLNDQDTAGDVVTNGMGLQGQRYSPLNAITGDTVKKMHPVWAFSFGGEKQRGQETQPMVKDA